MDTRFIVVDSIKALPRVVGAKAHDIPVANTVWGLSHMDIGNKTPELRVHGEILWT